MEQGGRDSGNRDWGWLGLLGLIGLGGLARRDRGDRYDSTRRTTT
jgi:MYXO-CTERM domain-containing protein